MTSDPHPEVAAGVSGASLGWSVLKRFWGRFARQLSWVQGGTGQLEAAAMAQPGDAGGAAKEKRRQDRGGRKLQDMEASWIQQ